ncbi:hypothetical protein EVAR_76895_1 [Eumeta japonica]|uniref:Uncharacterized protein n=1 Tax=Eumeta variegata TaxID=151549 RepID=A0A4C1SEL0_EUMVA|nr:hypothetical protein EVAR_76895_1 [Eumeta japonica]
MASVTYEMFMGEHVQLTERDRIIRAKKKIAAKKKTAFLFVLPDMLNRPTRTLAPCLGEHIEPSALGVVTAPASAVVGGPRRPLKVQGSY